MRGINKAILIGFVGQDPQIKTTQGGTVIATLSLATNDRVKKDGEWVDETQWHNLLAFGKTAEVIEEYVKKGKQLYIEGKLQTSSWEDRDSGKKMYKTEILVNQLLLLGDSGGRDSGGRDSGSRNNNREERSNSRDDRSSSRSSNRTSSSGNRTSERQQKSTEITDEDIPF